MSSLKIYSAIFILWIFPKIGITQETYSSKLKADTLKLTSLAEKSFTLFVNGQYANSIKCAEEVITFSQKLKHEYTNKTIQRLITKKEGNAYHVIGNNHYLQTNYSAALKYYFLAIKLREKINDKRGMSATYNNIGSIYSDISDTKKSLIYHNKSLAISRELEDKVGIAYSISNIGNLYYNKGNFDKCFANLKEALVLCGEIKDSICISQTLHNMAINYENWKNYDSAYFYHEQARHIREKIGDTNGIAQSYCNESIILRKQKKYTLSREMSNKSIEISKRLNQKSYLSNIYINLSIIDSIEGKSEQSYKDYYLGIAYSDSLAVEASKKNAIKIQMTYDFEKKEAIAKVEQKEEIKNQKIIAAAKNKKQVLIITFTCCGLLFLLIISYFIYGSLKKTKKQKTIIEHQKAEVELQKEISIVKQNEVLDSIHYAKRIQQALLPQEKYIKSHVNRLKLK